MARGSALERARTQAAYQPEAMADRVDHNIPFVIEQAPSWCEITAYASHDHSLLSWRSWYSLIMWPLRALCVALLLITHRALTLSFVVLSIATVIVIYVTR